MSSSVPCVATVALRYNPPSSWCVVVALSRSEFNAKWHIEGQKKDEEERALKAELRAAGEGELRKHLDMKAQQISKKKDTNRCARGMLLGVQSARRVALRLGRFGDQ